MNKQMKKTCAMSIARLLLLVLLVGICRQAGAATNTLVVDNGNWNTAGSWSLGTVPSGGDTVLVSNGLTVVVNALLSSSYTGDLIIQTNATLNHATSSILMENCMPSAPGRVLLHDGAEIRGQRWGNDGAITTISNDFILSGDTALTRTSYNVQVYLTGEWSGTGGVTFNCRTFLKRANDTFNFSGSAPNTYMGGTVLQSTSLNALFYANANGCFGTGDVTVNSDVELRLGGATTNTIDDTATLSLNGGGSINLYGNNETVALLNYYGHPYPTGTYSRVGSSSTVDYNVAWITGTGNGVLTVTHAPADPGAPTVTDISDNVSGGPVLLGPVTYTVQFSEPIDEATVSTATFEDGGTAAATIDSVTMNDPPLSCTVVATPTGTGNLILQVKAGAVVKNLFGIALNTTVAIPDDTTISVVAAATQDGIWNAQDGGWAVTANWLGANVAYGVGRTATFPNDLTANRTVTIDSDITIGNIIFEETDQHLTIAGSKTLTLAASSGTPELNTVDEELRISVVMDGNDGIRKTGAGPLFLDAANTFTGDFIIDGTGQINTKGGENNVFGADGGSIIVSTNVTINNGSSGWSTYDKSIAIENESVLRWVNGNSGWIILGPVSGDGGLLVNGAGGIDQRELDLRSTNNTFEGAIDLRQNNRATIRVNSLADSASANGNIIFDDGEASFRWNTGAVAPLTLNNRQIELTLAGGYARIENLNTTPSNTITINTDLLVDGAATGTKYLDLRGDNTGDNTFAGDIADGGSAVISVRKYDSGRWILSGKNTFTGPTTVSAGTLALVGSECLSDDGTLDISGSGVVEIVDRERIATLTFSGGAPEATGTWGTTASGAENPDDDRFSGTEILYVGEDFPPEGTVLIVR